MGDTPATLSWPDLRREAVSLIEAATDRALSLRLVGSTAIRLCSPEAERILLQMRKVPKDIDLVCRREDRRSLRQLLHERGYEIDKDMLVAMEGERFLFQHVSTGLKLDLFVDRLEFCHKVPLRGRLDRHALTISPEDLLLSKLQIVKLTEGDLIDLGTMLLCHDIGDRQSHAQGIDVRYVAGALGRDWGFWRTATVNLAHLRDRLPSTGLAGISESAAETVMARLDRLNAAIEAVPKTLGWKLRAGIGERMQWWQDVDDREGTY